MDIVKALRRFDFEHEPVYLRTAKGQIWRPIVADVTRIADSIPYKCRIAFVNSVFVPTSENTHELQLLAINVRLGVRVRIEVIERFLGQMNELHARATREEPQNRYCQQIGFQLVAAMSAIIKEGRMHRLANDDSIAVLFNPSKQRAYTDLIQRFRELWPKMEKTAPLEDEAQRGYEGSEAFLKELADINTEFMSLVIPEFIKKGGYAS
jgi:hypothetical protein